MNKTEVVRLMQEIAKEKGIDVTQNEVKTLMEIFDETIAKVGETLEIGDSVNLGVVKVCKKKVAARSGVSKLEEGKEVPWKTPEKIKIVLSAKKSFEKETEIILG